MAFTVAPAVPPQFFANDGTPADSYLLFVYEAGTATKTTTYQDSGGSTANTNPIVLDSSGRCSLFLDNSPGAPAVKFVLAPADDTDPPTAPIWTRDNVQPIPAGPTQLDVEGTAGESVAENDLLFLASGLSGFTAGKWYKADSDDQNSGLFAPFFGLATAAIAADADGIIRIAGEKGGFSGLTPGGGYGPGPTAGLLTAFTDYDTQRLVGVAKSATSFIIMQVNLLVDASLNERGLLNAGTQSIAGNKTAANQWTFGKQPIWTPGTSSPSSATALGVGRRNSYANATGVGNGAGAETVLYSTSITADTIDADNMVIELEASGICANTGSADKRIRVRLGTTTLMGTVFYDSGATTNQNKKWNIKVKIYRTGAATQYSEGIGLLGSATLGAAELYNVYDATGTEAFISTNLLEVTGVGTNASDVVLRTAVTKIS